MPSSISSKIFVGHGEQPLKAAELKMPITLLRIETIATIATSNGGEQQIHKPYTNCFAKYISGSRKVNKGQNEDNKSKHIFIIRLDPTLEIMLSDYVALDNLMFQIQSVKPSNKYKSALELSTVEVENFEFRDTANVNDSLQQEVKPTGSISNIDTPTWID